MRGFVLFLLIIFANLVKSDKTESRDIEDGRDKAKYALLTHLGIMFAAKVGLYKIILGIALVVVSIKAMVVMAWVLAAFKYVPDAWPYYNNDVVINPYNGGNYDKYYRPPMHFFYVVATKLFVLKIVYGVIFYVILTKAWHFVIWFIHYLKEKKSHEHYVEFDHYDHHDHHGYYDHQPYSGYEYTKPSYGVSDSYNKFKKQGVYDADGSYSVKNS